MRLRLYSAPLVSEATTCLREATAVLTVVVVAVVVVVVVVEVLDETGKHKKEEREEKERGGGTYLFRQCAQVKVPVTGRRNSSKSSSSSS